jgi:hypothetical protein
LRKTEIRDSTAHRINPDAIQCGNDQDIAGKFAIDNLQVFDTAITDFSGRLVEAIPEPGSAAIAGLALALFALRRSSLFSVEWRSGLTVAR